MTVPPPMASSHSILNISVDPEDLKQVLSLSHGKKPMATLTFDDVKPLVFGDEHLSRLRMDVSRHGVQHPIVLIRKRLYGDVVLVDGCTRALMAMELNLIIPAELHFCFCLTTYANPNSICVHVKNSVNQHKANAAATGWKHDIILGT